MTRRYSALLAIAIGLLTVSTVRAQGFERTQTFGLSAALQGSQMEILMPIWVSDGFVLAPSVGLVMSEDVATDLSIGIAPRLVFNAGSRLRPYAGAKLGALMFSPESGESATDILVGLAAGGEYFFDTHFSVGVEGQLNAVFSDDHSARFVNPGKMNINTATAIGATIYF